MFRDPTGDDRGTISAQDDFDGLLPIWSLSGLVTVVSVAIRAAVVLNVHLKDKSNPKPRQEAGRLVQGGFPA